MSNSVVDPFSGPSSFGSYLEAVDAPAAPTEGAPVAGEVLPTPSPSGFDENGIAIPATAAAGTGDTGVPGTGTDGAADKAGTATQPAGTGDAGYARDPKWERQLVDDLGAASTAMADRVREVTRRESLQALRQEYEQYFQIIDAPARLLIGKNVPSLDPDKDTETIRDASDAKDYQEATKALLAKELGSRVQSGIREQAPFLSIMSQSIDLLQRNPDLLRDKVLADRVAGLLEPYEYRQNGHLVGYTTNVIPLVDQVRKQLVAERAAGAAPPAAKVAPAAPKPAGPGPQQGIKSSAAQQAGGESFDQLWSTLGLAPGTMNI